MGNARETAVRGLIEVFDRNGFSNLVLDSLMRQDELSPQDRAFCSALFYGVVEKRITLDWVLKQYSETPMAETTSAVREILRLALYQLIFMPSVPPSAAVDEAVKLTRVFRAEIAAGFVNGVLRSFLRSEMAFALPKHRLDQLSVQYSVPTELLALWNTVYGKDKTAEILSGIGGPPPIFARVNTLKTTVEELIPLLQEEGVTAEPAGFPGALRLYEMGSVTALSSFEKGLFHIQDLSSQQCAAALGVLPGMRVLDVCSAPGGKSFTLAETMENSGELLAMDLSGNRLSLVSSGAERLGITILRTSINDAAKPNSLLGQFDRILCDVPCSGYGVIRRKPEIRYKTPESVRELPALQLQILTVSSGYLAPGGRMVYSTCTLNRAENEKVVQSFLLAHSDFALDGEMTTVFPTKEGGDGFFFAPIARRT